MQFISSKGVASGSVKGETTQTIINHFNRNTSAYVAIFVNVFVSVDLVLIIKNHLFFYNFIILSSYKLITLKFFMSLDPINSS